MLISSHKKACLRLFSLSIMPRGIMRVSGVSGMGTMLCCGMDDGRRRRIEHGSTKWRGGAGEPRQRDGRRRATPGSVTWEVVFRTDQTLSPNLVFILPFDELCACSYIHRTAVEFRTCVLKKRKGRKTKRREGVRVPIHSLSLSSLYECEDAWLVWLVSYRSRA